MIGVLTAISLTIIGDEPENKLMKLNTIDGSVLKLSIKNDAFKSYKTLTRSNKNTKDIIHDYTFKNESNLKITERLFTNGDELLFFEYRNPKTETEEIKVAYQKNDITSYQLNSFEKHYVPREHDNTFGIDKTTYPVGLLTLTKLSDHSLEQEKSIMVGKNYISKELITEYEDNTKSSIRELIDENSETSINQSKKQFNFTMTLQSKGNDISETWMMMSDEALFKDEKNLDDWIEYSNNEFVQTNKWYTPEGSYVKMPWSIEPFSELGYGRKLLALVDKEALDRYKSTDERYFHNLIMNSITNLYRYKGDDTMWQTEITSTWLKKKYGTRAPYIDTRYNEIIALYLNEVHKTLNVPNIDEPLNIYADFLVEKSKTEERIIVNKNETLLPDYYSVNRDTDKKTHASLNHELGGINLLLDQYALTNKEEYLNVANQLLDGIETLGDDWIKENGDLWYQYNNNATFEGEDYPLLTLTDLLFTKQKLAELNEDNRKIIDKLILSKLNYIKENKLPITVHAEELLQNNGFKKNIANYDNIVKY